MSCQRHKKAEQVILALLTQDDARKGILASTGTKYPAKRLALRNMHEGHDVPVEVLQFRNGTAPVLGLIKIVYEH